MQVQARYESMSDAHAHRYSIILDLETLLRDVFHARRTHDQIQLLELRSRREQFIRALSIWHEKSGSLLSQAISSSNIDQVLSSRILKLRYLMAMAYSLSVEVLETSLDKHLDLFSKALQEASTIIELMESHYAKSAFTFEMCVIAPLYWIGQKCRYPAIRLQTIQLLHRSPVQKGLWYASQAVNILERTMVIEGLQVRGKAACYHTLHPDRTASEDGAQATASPSLTEDLPRENDRIQRIATGLTTVRNGQRGSLVTFSKSSAPDQSQWLEWQEWIGF